jgi:hypothetical protein
VGPPNGALLGAAAWGHGCPGQAGLCGTAKDPSGVTQVVVSIRAENGQWWGGSSYNSSTETYQAATLVSGASPGAKTEWSYKLPLPQDGQYTLHVRATDGAGNTTAPLASTFTVDTKAPPQPSILSGPETTTTAKSATFTFTDAESPVTLECRRDSANFKACTSPLTYASNSKAAHVFQVRAKDGAGNLSSVASYSWTVVKTTAEEGKPFTITGNASEPLAPGVTRALLVTIHNPNNVPITVTALGVAVASGSSKAGCDGPSNLTLTQSDISSTNTVSVPAEGQLTLPSGGAHAPQVLMRNLSTNQDACKGATFTFNYSGSAHS